MSGMTSVFCDSTGDGGEWFSSSSSSSSNWSGWFSLTWPSSLPSEFVEVVHLPLDEFQTKLDGESPVMRPSLWSSRRRALTLCGFILQICWRKRNSWWTARSTSSPWGWPRPSSSPGSFLSWSSEPQTFSHREMSEDVCVLVTPCGPEAHVGQKTLHL